ncbi:MAG: addiction module antidote protein [Rickettsiales bacterium]
MSKTKLTKFDMADYLTTEKEIMGFLKAAIEDNDPEYLPHALGVVARSIGMTKVAKKAGVTRANLYKAFSKGGNPEFITVLKVLDALGLKFSIAKA